MLRKTIQSILGRKLQSLNGLELSLRNFEHNYKQYAQYSALAPVIKANAYGHGAKEICEMMKRLNIQAPFVCVDNIAEYLDIRNVSPCPVLIFNYGLSENYQRLRSYKNLRLSCSSVDQAQKMLGLKFPIHLELETGLHRTGLHVEEILEHKELFKKLNIQGIFSHLGEGEKDSLRNTEQWKAFQKAKTQLESHGFSFSYVHFSNSGGAQIKEFQGCIARVGIGLLGVDPRNTLDLKQVASYYCRVIRSFTLKKGEFLGYGSNFQAEEDTPVAVLAAGYREGIPRSLSQKAEFLGLINMNHSFIHNTDHLQEGEIYYYVDKTKTWSKRAEESGVIPYELMARLPDLLSRKIL